MYNHVLPAIGSKQLNKLTKFDVQALVYNMSNNIQLSSTSVRLVYCVLHKIINFAVDMELVEKDVCRNVKLPKQTKYEPKIYSKADINKLINTAQDSFLYIVILLASQLGLRRSEILSLTWFDINVYTKKIFIYNSKSAYSIRTLDMPETLSQALREHKGKQEIMLQERGIKQTDTTLVVCKADGTAYNQTFISRKFSEFLQTHGLPETTLHSLRHSYATHAHDDGMPVKRLARALGHASAAMSVDTYVNIFD
jgi:integrase